MNEHIRKIRPARAAIAAVLVMSATPVLAQVAAPPSVTPTIAPAAPAPAAPAPAPAASVPTAPAFAASQPVVQQTPSVEERRAASIAAAEAEAETNVAAPRAARPRAVTPNVERADAAVTSIAAPAAPVAATPSPVVAPEPAASDAAAAPVLATEPAAPVTEVQAMTTGTDDALLWAMGGTALLLLGLGGAAIARRRRPIDAVEGRHSLIQDTPVAVPVAHAPVAPMPVAPMATTAASIAAPVGRETFAHEPGGQENATLAAMVAAPPSAENPFLTHAKRLRRARLLLAQRAAVPAPVMTQTQSQTQVATPAAAMDRSQTVYRFGGEAARPGILRPRTR